MCVCFLVFYLSDRYSSVSSDDVPCVKAAYIMGYGLFTESKKWIVLEISGNFVRFERLFAKHSSAAHPRTLVVLRQGLCVCVYFVCVYVRVYCVCV